MNQRLHLVAGASKGLGRAVALALAQNPDNVVFAVARSAPLLQSLPNPNSGKRIVLAPADLSQRGTAERLALAVHNQWGKIHSLSSFLGAPHILTPLSHLSPDELSNSLNSHVIANHSLIRSFEPLLLQASNPRALFAVCDHSPTPFRSAVASPNAALESLVLSWAREHDASPLNINLFNPGAVASQARAASRPGEDPTSIPQPSDVAPAVIPLLSPQNNNHAQRLNFPPPP